MRLVNFKAFENVTLDFRKLTFILGPNNSGKSSILAAPRILSQTADSYDSRIPILLNGVLGDFGTYKDIVFGNDRRKHFEIELFFQTPVKLDIPSNRKLSTYSICLNFRHLARRREIILNSFDAKNNDECMISTKYSANTEKHIIRKIHNTTIPPSIRYPVSENLRMRNFSPYVPFLLSEKVFKKHFSKKDLNDITISLRNWNRVSVGLNSILTNIEFLGAMRIPPSRTYQYSGERRKSVGVNGEDALSLMVMDSLRSGGRTKKILENVVKWLKSAKISSDIKIHSLSDRHYEIHIKHPITGEYQNFSDVGYGISQVLPIIIGGHNLNRNTTYIVEEPEIHLHPRAQAELGELFLDLYKRNIQTIVETHSEHIVLRIQQHVASGKMSPDEVNFYYVYPKKDGKKIVKLELDSKGKFINEWPEGFFPERLVEAKRLSKFRYKY